MRAAALASFILVACVAGSPEAPPRATTVIPPSPAAASTGPAPSKPRPSAPVLVVVVVDQLGSWVFDQRQSSLSPDGAFAQLLREGVYAPQLRYEHATTSTAPGHATLFTGLPPVGSGVFANERLDEASGKPVSVFADPTSRVVLDGTQEATSSSAAILSAPTLADALRAQRPQSLIISLSLKDRAAIPGGGRQPDAVAWFETSRAAFVTSTAFRATLPAFVLAHNAGLERSLTSTWKPLDESWLRHHAPTNDDQPGEADFGLGIRFPHHLAQAKQRAALFRAHPSADQAVLRLAIGALNELDPGASSDRPVLLALSLSAFDYVGHFHGPDSWESWEAFRQLDQELKAFFSELEQRYGDRLAVLLSADHGTTVLPETAGNLRARPWCKDPVTPDALQRPCAPGQRLYRDELEALLRKAAAATLGAGDFVRAVVEPFAYFTPAVAELPVARRAAFEKAAVAALEGHPGIAQVFVRRTFAAPCPPSSDVSLRALVCRSLPPGSGDLYIVSQPGSFFDPNLVRGRGINHGSPYLYDRAVPVFARAAKRGRVPVRLSAPVLPADFTNTAAKLLGIRPPSGATSGRDMFEL